MYELVELKLTRDEICILLDVIQDGIHKRKDDVARCKKYGFYKIAGEHDTSICDYIDLKKKVLEAKHNFDKSEDI